MQTCITYYCVQELQGSSGKVVIEKEKIDSMQKKEVLSIHYTTMIT